MVHTVAKRGDKDRGVLAKREIVEEEQDREPLKEPGKGRGEVEDSKEEDRLALLEGPIQHMMEMGFSRAEVTHALELARHDANRAL